MANGDLQCRAVLCTLVGSSELCIASYVRMSAIRHVPRGMCAGGGAREGRAKRRREAKKGGEDGEPDGYPVHLPVHSTEMFLPRCFYRWLTGNSGK